MAESDAETKRVTWADLKAGVDLAIGRTFRLEIAEEQVEVGLEWPADVVERLPDDFKLSLSGPEVAKQELAKSAATAADGDMRRFTFTWQGPGKTVTLEASGNGHTVVLWREHAAADLLAPVQWVDQLDTLFAEQEEVEIAGVSTGASRVPADLKNDELRTLLAGLA